MNWKFFQVGQVIQVYPHQVALMGAIPALVIGFSTKLLNFYSLWLLVVLFLERKRAKVRQHPGVSYSHMESGYMTLL